MSNETYTVTDRRHRDSKYDEEKDKAHRESIMPASLIVEEPHLTDEELIKKYSFIKRVLNSHLIIHLDSFAYKGKIIIPAKQQHKPTRGLVVAKAADITDIEVGERILISQYAGFLLKFENVPLARSISYSEVIFTLHKDAPNIEEEGA
jgi:hypothetical protein